MTTLIAYSGNSDYCYPNSLRMTLQAAGMDARAQPEVGFLECLTTLPFGKMFLDLEEGPIILFSSSEVDPDQGLTLAFKALGWTCLEQRGQEPDEALAALRQAVRQAPVLVGPIDLGYLRYNPFHNSLAGGDHFVVVLAVQDETILLHDPWKFPCVSLPLSAFLQAWRAERIEYLQAPYTFRSDFRKAEQISRQETIERTLTAVQAHLKAEKTGPVLYSNAHALRMLAAGLRTPEPPTSLTASLTTFVFPLGARRAIDAAAFLREAGLLEAARDMEQQALLCGQAQYPAVCKQYGEVARLADQLADVEQRLTESLLAL